MSVNRKKYTAEEKAKIALEALSEQQTMSELTSKYGVHKTQIAKWKKHLKSEVGKLFQDKGSPKESSSPDSIVDELYKEIGRLTVECEFLKKKSALFD